MARPCIESVMELPFALKPKIVTSIAIIEGEHVLCKKDFAQNAARIYLFKVNNGNTRTVCEISSKLIINIPERHSQCRSDVFVVNFEHISFIALVFPL